MIRSVSGLGLGRVGIYASGVNWVLSPQAVIELHWEGGVGQLFSPKFK